MVPISRPDFARGPGKLEQLVDFLVLGQLGERLAELLLEELLLAPELVQVVRDGGLLDEVAVELRLLPLPPRSCSERPRWTARRSSDREVVEDREEDHAAATTATFAPTGALAMRSMSLSMARIPPRWRPGGRPRAWSARAAAGAAGATGFGG